MLLRLYDEGEHNEILRRIREGGSLFLIERTDSNKYVGYEMFSLRHAHSPPPKLIWIDKIEQFRGIEFFLTKLEAENHNNGFREGGCECCGNNSTEIPTKVIEYDFRYSK